MLEPKRPAHSRSEDERPEVSVRAPSDVLRLRVILLEIVPPVWRRLEVPSHLTLRQFHSVLQCAMGWTSSEAHRFRVGDTIYGKTSEDEAGPRDSRWVTLADVAALGAMPFRYELLAGETWEHDIRIESVSKGTPGNQRPVCVDGERACPPEAFGGPDAFVECVDFLAGEALQPHAFDRDAVNRALARLR